jgi:3-oxoacyl-[acyl-carrier-protein] synthase II
MSRQNRRAVFSGAGVLAPGATSFDALAPFLAQGQSAIQRIRTFDVTELPSQIAGEVLGFDAKKLAAKEMRKSLKNMARTVQMGLIAAQFAAEHARLTKGVIPPARLGVDFGCVMVATELDDLVTGAHCSVPTPPKPVDYAAWGSTGLSRVTPLWMLKYLPNMPACHVSIQHDAQGPNNTITTGDVAGLLSIGEAFRILARNQADAFFVGGCDSRINPLSFTRFNLFQPLSRRNDDPAHAVRPYDRHRDGTALSEAAAIFLLETPESAAARNVQPLAELCGFASGYDRGRTGKVLAQVIRRALAEAQITANDVDHVNGAASGYPELDAFEARGIAEVFGQSTPVFAPRGHFGAAGAASGPLELAATFAAFQTGELPGTIGFREPDPECPVQVHVGPARPITKPYAVKVSFTDLGQCSALVVRRI